MADKRKSDKLTKKDILHLAKLANLSLDEKEIKELQSKLGDTIEYVQNLGEIDTSQVSAAYRTHTLQNVTFEDGLPSSRTLTAKQVTHNAPKTEKNYFKVDKILDK